MATRDELYLKFGVTAEAAQLLETDLGIILLGVEGWKNGWHIEPEPERILEFCERLDRKTLGQILNEVRRQIEVEDALIDKLIVGLSTRNRLNHGFFKRHEVAMRSDGGRDKMVHELDRMHADIDEASQVCVNLLAAFGRMMKNGPSS